MPYETSPWIIPPLLTGLVVFYYIILRFLYMLSNFFLFFFYWKFFHTIYFDNCFSQFLQDFLINIFPHITYFSILSGRSLWKNIFILVKYTSFFTFSSMGLSLVTFHQDQGSKTFSPANHMISFLPFVTDWKFIFVKAWYLA